MRVEIIRRTRFSKNKWLNYYILQLFFYNGWKAQRFHTKEKGKRKLFQEKAILDWYVYLIDFFRLKIGKVKSMLSQFASISKTYACDSYRSSSAYIKRLIRFNISLGTKNIEFIDFVETDDDEFVKGTSLLVVLIKLAPVFKELTEK